MPVRCLLLFGIVTLPALCASASAAEMSHPRVPGYERFYAAPSSKPAEEDDDEVPLKLDPVTGGRMLLTELNCTSCHAAPVEGAARLAPKQAPVLDDVGSRIKVEWLRAFLANPQHAKPGTTMPDLLASIPAEKRGPTIEALVHFLASTGRVTESRSNAATAARGAALFHRIGCLACHDAQDADAPRLATSAPLPNLDQKYTVQSLTAFLQDPVKTRPSGRMPSLGLSEEDARSLAHHFVRGNEAPPTVHYAVYHGHWDKVPDVTKLTPVSEGMTSDFELSIAGQHDKYAIRFTTYLRVLKEDRYHFWLGSDDGSRMTIDDEAVVNCDGIHPHQTKDGHATLLPGFHKVIVDYFQGGGEASLQVEMAGAGMSRQSLIGQCYLEAKVPEPVATPDRPAFALDPKLAAEGRKLFASVGCASCHAMTVDGQKIVSELTAKPLASLRVDQGCLAERVIGTAPQYQLSSVQRTSLAAAIPATEIEPSGEQVHRTLATLNCYSCHQRGKIGGVEAARNDSFQSLQKEMGDEGRLPPVITGVGDKLRPDWLRHVLHNSADDRKNYMVTRMPKFGAANVDSLVTQFEIVDRQPDAMPKAEFTDPDYRIKAAGRQLVGGQALSCIKCHDFGEHPSTGVRAINLTTMTRRLREDWFYRYVLDPQVYRRGTRMPSPWPSGRATIQEVLHADANQQIQAVWRYLSDGTKAAVPSGLMREPIELKPESEPIVYRNFIEGAGTRAIGVGYPGGINLAFDANKLRLAMVWHGAFIDASRHWTGRGQGFEAPLGDDILSLPDRVPFARLEQPDSAFPQGKGKELGYQFLGYRLDSRQQPIFRYSFAGLVVEDHPEPVANGVQLPTLKRTLSFEGQDAGQMWYCPVVAGNIEDLGGGRYRIDQTWTLEITDSDALHPVVREKEGKRELLIPVPLMNGRGIITQKYVW